LRAYGTYPAPTPRSASISTFTMANVHTWALTAALQIELTSGRRQSAWRPDPGRSSTDQHRDSIRTAGTDFLCFYV